MSVIISITRGLIPLGLLLAIAAGYGVASFFDDSGKDQVTIEGKITEVMEICPPRLSVKTKDGVFKVQVLDETKVFEKGKQADFGKLCVNQLIRVTGTRQADSKEKMVNAQKIEIVK